MRLKKLKLSGFKSFVDPTVVLFPSHRVGVVGPNGCGKSNIIDAVRWVMGESSAKNLRGVSMADVIFNGALNRKPVGQATVELIFDNTEGRLTGEYAQYAEISIKRVVTRDGQSTYYLNNTRCRRKDVSDIFSGTGLGPRSYAIIGQNTISHIIEAKPDELRLYIEEAAGISKYKDRRRDAQNRMENTRENLARVNDICEELNKQVARLERQATAAAQYTTWNTAARQRQAECDGMRWKQFHQAWESLEKMAQEQQNLLENGLVQLRELDGETSEIKALHQSTLVDHTEKQNTYYHLGVEAARLKEAITHQHQQREKLKQDLEQAKTALSLALEKLAQNEDTFRVLSDEINVAKPILTDQETIKINAEKAFIQSETDKQTWQKNWDAFNQSATETSQKIKVLQTHLENSEEAINTGNKRLVHLEKEWSDLEKTEHIEEALNTWKIEESAFQETLEMLKETLDTCSKTSALHREDSEKKREKADLLKKQLQQKQGELTTLETLQQAALGQKDEWVKQWLKKQTFANQPKLAQQIEVESGWEKAVERILGNRLQGICVKHFDSLGNLDEITRELTQGECTLIDVAWKATDATKKANSLTRLIDKIKYANDAVNSLLQNIYIAENLEEARTLEAQLQDHESIVTRDGAWLGKGWLQWTYGKKASDGILEREKALKQLSYDIDVCEDEWNQLSMAYKEECAIVAEYELKCRELSEQIQITNQKWVDCRAQIRVQQSQFEHIQQRQTQLNNNISEQQIQLKAWKEQQEDRRSEWELLSKTVEENDRLREQWIQTRETLNQKHIQLRNQAEQDRESWHNSQIKLMGLESQQVSIQQMIDREKDQIITLEQHCEQHLLSLDKAESPDTHLDTQWSSVNAKHAEQETVLKESSEALEALNQRLGITEKTRAALETTLREIQETLQKKRLEAQTFKIKCENIEETLTGLNLSLSSILENLPEDATIEASEKALATLEHKIKQLGPINLAALDEFKAESERKQLLDEQYDDLIKALETLEEAIRQIDQETRLRFQETYNAINKAFQDLFPRLFGGGQAYMELTENDCLEAGVTIMAQPPGKRNSSIYLLSGGEKAMTAVSLIFAIFQLNPSPFCMLDEVDAPLDDTNVGRFCAMLKEMSEQVQFIFITHNKITMELSTHLSGVTMHEPGVSRIVTVDIDEAVSLSTA